MSDNQGPKPAPKPMRRWVKILLALSLALNFLVLGAVGSAVISHKFRGGHWGGPGGKFGHYSRALSREDRQAIGKAMRQELGAPKDEWRRMRGHYQALAAALTAEDFDMGAVKTLLDSNRNTLRSRQDLAQRLLLERLQQMSPEQRRKFARRLTKMATGWGGKRH